jgi:hypothetical protein
MQIIKLSTLANRSSNLGIGAKDSSNHLVAGSLRSFPRFNIFNFYISWGKNAFDKEVKKKNNASLY